MGATFINIELEVRANFDLTELASALGKRFGINYCGPATRGKYLLSGAYYGNRRSGPDAIALGLCNQIGKLRSPAKRLWSKASDRVFDIGFDANLTRDIGLHVFDSATIARISKVGARVAISVYTWDIESGSRTRKQLRRRTTRTQKKSN